MTVNHDPANGGGAEEEERNGEKMLILGSISFLIDGARVRERERESALGYEKRYNYKA
jgi:hypothetical protein